MNDEKKRLAIFTIAVRVYPEQVGGSIYAIDTKTGYLDDIDEFSILLEREDGEMERPW